jgi:tripartite-type tricarboxylate transporter receptor subunit TctC
MKNKNWCLFALVLMCESIFAQSNSWLPNKPVRLIVPQVAGGGADAIGRTIGQALSEKIGQPVIVDNRPGTNGGVGMDVLLNAPADGYNLILVFTSMMAINPAVYEKINYDPLRDLKSLGAVCEVPLVMIASSKVPANNLKELISSLKSDPQSVFGASSGNGSFSHMMIEILNTKIGVKMTHIPFKGEGPAVAHVLSGQDSIIYVGTPAIILSQVQSGKLKALGVTTAKRMNQIPNIPTLAESGLPDFNESFWYGLAASSNTPQFIIEAYNKVVNDIAKSDNLQSNLGKMGCNPLPLTSQEFTEKVRNDIKKYSSIAKSVNMKVD